MGPETRTRQGADHQNQRKGWNATDGVAIRADSAPLYDLREYKTVVPELEKSFKRKSYTSKAW